MESDLPVARVHSRPISVIKKVDFSSQQCRAHQELARHLILEHFPPVLLLLPQYGILDLLHTAIGLYTAWKKGKTSAVL